MRIHITHYQIKALLELSEGSGDPEAYDDMTLVLVADNSAHSGPGLYAQFQEVPEEGYMFLGKDGKDQDIGDALCSARIASGQVEEI